MFQATFFLGGLPITTAKMLKDSSSSESESGSGLFGLILDPKEAAGLCCPRERPAAITHGLHCQCAWDSQVSIINIAEDLPSTRSRNGLEHQLGVYVGIGRVKASRKQKMTSYRANRSLDNIQTVFHFIRLLWKDKLVYLDSILVAHNLLPEIVLGTIMSKREESVLTLRDRSPRAQLLCLLFPRAPSSTLWNKRKELKGAGEPKNMSTEISAVWEMAVCVCAGYSILVSLLVWSENRAVISTSMNQIQRKMQAPFFLPTFTNRPVFLSQKTRAATAITLNSSSDERSSFLTLLLSSTSGGNQRKAGGSCSTLTSCLWEKEQGQGIPVLSKGLSNRPTVS